MPTYRTARPLPIRWGRAVVEPVRITFVGETRRTLVDSPRFEAEHPGARATNEGDGAMESEGDSPDWEFCE